MALSEQEISELRRQGADARAVGRAVFENPLYSADRAPPTTGEPIPHWIEKVGAWNLGWRIEDSVWWARAFLIV